MNNKEIIDLLMSSTLGVELKYEFKEELNSMTPTEKENLIAMLEKK